MAAPINGFKQALLAGETVFGCWMSIGEAYTAEILSGAGFDWLLIDGEHSPNDIRSIRDQMIALKGSASHPVVRVPVGETWIVKQVLDLGCQTVLVPMVETAEQARELVRACRYPPDGIRGVGYSVSRVSNFGQTENYGPTANAQICLLVQVESKVGLENLDEILAEDVTGAGVRVASPVERDDLTPGVRMLVERAPVLVRTHLETVFSFSCYVTAPLGILHQSLLCKRIRPRQCPSGWTRRRACGPRPGSSPSPRPPRGGRP